MDTGSIKRAIGKHKLMVEKKKPNSLFVLLTIISNNSLISTLAYFLLLIVEAFHYLYLPVQFVNNTDESFSFFAKIASYVNYFRHLVDIEHQVGIFICILLHLFFLVFMISAICLILYYGSKVNTSQTKIVAYMSYFTSSFLVLITTALLIPMIESFIFPSLCLIDESISSSLLFECGSYGQIILSVFGSIFTLILLAFFIIFNEVMLDDYWLSSLPWAGESHDVQMMHGISKMMLSIFLGIDLKGDYLKFYEVSLNLWTIFIVVIIGLSCGSIAFLRADHKRKELLQKNWNEIKTISEAENYVQVSCSLCFGSQGTPEWNFFKHYTTSLHTKECSEPECVCLQQLSPDYGPDSKWFKLFERILEQLNEKWENSRIIMMQISYYQCLIMKNYFKSYYYLLTLDTLRNQQTQKYLIYRMKNILSNYIISKETKNSSAHYLWSVIKFQKTCTLFRALIGYTTNLIISFWNLLEASRLNVQELYKIGQNITQALRWVNDTFQYATELSPEYPFNYS